MRMRQRALISVVTALAWTLGGGLALGLMLK
jgi:hypothetical protein